MCHYKKSHFILMSMNGSCQLFLFQNMTTDYKMKSSNQNNIWMCAFYYKETKASNIPSGTEVFCAMYVIQTVSHTRFSSWLSRQTFWKLSGGLFGTDIECIVFYRNLLNPEVFPRPYYHKTTCHYHLPYPKPAGNTHQFHRHAKKVKIKTQYEVETHHPRTVCFCF